MSQNQNIIIKKFHGKIIQNPDGTFTAITNQGYTFTLNIMFQNSCIDYEDLVMAIVDALAQLINSGQIIIGSQSGNITIPKKATS